MVDSIEMKLTIITTVLQSVIEEAGKWDRDAVAEAKLLLASTKQLHTSLLEMRADSVVFATNLNIGTDFMTLCDDNSVLFCEWAETHQITIPDEVVG